MLRFMPWTLLTKLRSMRMPQILDRYHNLHGLKIMSNNPKVESNSEFDFSRLENFPINFD